MTESLHIESTLTDVLNIKHYMAGAVENTMTLAETLDWMRTLLKNIAFESKIVNREYGDLFNEEDRKLARNVLEHEFRNLYYCQCCIDAGNYKEVNPYVD